MASIQKSIDSQKLAEIIKEDREASIVLDSIKNPMDELSKIFSEIDEKLKTFKLNNCDDLFKRRNELVEDILFKLNKIFVNENISLVKDLREPKVKIRGYVKKIQPFIIESQKEVLSDKTIDMLNKFFKNIISKTDQLSDDLRDFIHKVCLSKYLRETLTDRDETKSLISIEQELKGFENKQEIVDKKIIEISSNFDYLIEKMNNNTISLLLTQVQEKLRRLVEGVIVRVKYSKQITYDIFLAKEEISSKLKIQNEKVMNSFFGKQYYQYIQKIDILQDERVEKYIKEMDKSLDEINSDKSISKKVTDFIDMKIITSESMFKYALYPFSIGIKFLSKPVNVLKLSMASWGLLGETAMSAEAQYQIQQKNEKAAVVQVQENEASEKLEEIVQNKVFNQGLFCKDGQVIIKLDKEGKKFETIEDVDKDLYKNLSEMKIPFNPSLLDRFNYIKSTIKIQKDMNESGLILFALRYGEDSEEYNDLETNVNAINKYFNSNQIIYEIFKNNKDTYNNIIKNLDKHYFFLNENNLIKYQKKETNLDIINSKRFDKTLDLMIKLEEEGIKTNQKIFDYLIEKNNSVINQILKNYKEYNFKNTNDFEEFIKKDKELNEFCIKLANKFFKEFPQEIELSQEVAKDKLLNGAILIKKDWIELKNVDEKDILRLRAIISRNLTIRNKEINKKNVKKELKRTFSEIERNSNIEIFFKRDTVYLSGNDKSGSGGKDFDFGRNKDKLEKYEELNSITFLTSREGNKAINNDESYQKIHDEFFKAIEKANKLTIVFDTHGNANDMTIGGELLGVGFGKIRVKITQLAKAFNKRWENRKLKENSDRDIIIFDACHSTEFSRKLYELLDPNVPKPIIIVASEYGLPSIKILPHEKETKMNTLDAILFPHTEDKNLINDKSTQEKAIKKIEKNKIKLKDVIRIFKENRDDIKNNPGIYAPDENNVIQQLSMEGKDIKFNYV
ncbi:hypothetical protein KY334_03535 [Candidatus Woesearchaeota archaeon]|nr:hypothetical protein [Candidatus Woesearchaeota archaeon]